MVYAIWSRVILYGYHYKKEEGAFLFLFNRDEVYVINVRGYSGSSTKSEIESARATGKLVHYLEDV